MFAIMCLAEVQRVASVVHYIIMKFKERERERERERETSDPTCKLLSWDYPVKHSRHTALILAWEPAEEISVPQDRSSSQAFLELMQMWSAMKSAEYLEHIINMQTSCWRMQLPHVSIHCVHLHAGLLHCTWARSHTAADERFCRGAEWLFISTIR